MSNVKVIVLCILLTNNILSSILSAESMTLLDNGTEAIKLKDSIDIFENKEAKNCFLVSGDQPLYVVRGRMTLVNDVKAIAFQKQKLNSTNFETQCLMDVLEACLKKTKRQCYCSTTNNTDKGQYDIVWNSKLQNGDSNGKVRVAMIILGMDKIYSNELNLPALYNPNVDNFNFELQINYQPVNTENCTPTIRSDTVNLKYIYKSVRSAPIQLSITEDNIHTTLNENVVETYTLKSFQENTLINITFIVHVCNTNLNNFHCIFNKALPVSNHDKNNYVFLIISTIAIVVVFCIIIPVALFSYLRKNRPRLRTLRNTRRRQGKARSRESTLMESFVIAEMLNYFKDYKNQPCTEMLNYFKDYKNQPYTAEDLNINLVLIGKPGHGKSVTGNSILGEEKFTSTSNPTHSSHDVVRHSTTFLERSIFVVDGPNIKGDKHDTDTLKKLFEVTKDEEGFDAIIMVMRFSASLRYNSNDAKRLERLKLILGNQFVRKRCIIVMTGGDTFEKDTKEVSILNWCKKMEGPIKELFEECDYRVVLFDNKTSDKDVKNGQLTELIKMVDKIILNIIAENRTST